MATIKSRSEVIYSLIKLPFNHKNNSKEVAAEITTMVLSTLMIVPITIAVPCLWTRGITIIGVPINQPNLLLVLVIFCTSTFLGLGVYKIRQDLITLFMS